MYKLIVLVLALAASTYADSQLVKTSAVGANIVPAGTAYMAPISGYTAGAYYPQYQGYQGYQGQYQPYAHQYSSYPYTGYASYPGYQSYVAPMPYASYPANAYPAAAAAAYPVGSSQVLYQQKPLTAAAHGAYVL